MERKFGGTEAGHLLPVRRTRKQLEVLVENVKEAAELLPVLFKRALDLHQTTFAMGESIAHLHALQSQGLVRATTGADGVRRFSAPA